MRSADSTMATRVYRFLLRLIAPPSFRAEYGEQTARLAADLVTQARRRGGHLAGVVAFGRELVGMVGTGLHERHLAAKRWRGRPRKASDGRSDVTELVNVWVQDVRFAIRTLAKRPGTTFAALTTLALGIGANTAIFSVVSGVLLRTLDYAHAERVAYVLETNREGNPRALSYENFRDWQEQNEVFEDIAVWVGNSTNVTGRGKPERIRGMFVTASYFTVAGVQPALGRADARPGR